MTDRPYRLIVTDDQTRTFRRGEAKYYPTMLDAANAFAKSPMPYKAIVFDDGCVRRELTDDEEALLAGVCNKLGLVVEAA